MADDHVDVVPELLLPGRPGDQPAVAARHVTGEEVQPGQLDAGVLDRRDERVDVAVGRHGLGERPPELDRVEPGRLAAAGRSSSGSSVKSIEQLTV